MTLLREERFGERNGEKGITAHALVRHVEKEGEKRGAPRWRITARSDWHLKKKTELIKRK